jgi:hypothetical protein
MIKNRLRQFFTGSRKTKKPVHQNNSTNNIPMKKIFFGLIILLTLLFIFELGLSIRPVVVTDYSTDSVKQATVYYYLPQSILTIRSTATVEIFYENDPEIKTARIIGQTFELSSDLIADTDHLLSLNYKGDFLMADDVKFVVNAKGLLESANIVTEDRTSAIVTKVAEGMKGLTDSLSPLKAAYREGKPEIREYTAEFQWIPTELPYDTIKWEIEVENRTTIELRLIPKLNAGFILEMSHPPTKKISVIDTMLVKYGREMEGIFTRPIRNLRFTLNPLAPGLTHPIPFHFTVADRSQLVVVPVERTPFVRRVNDIQIRDGIIISHKIVKPSSAEGLVSIPFDIAKMIVSIPAEIISLKLDFTQRPKALIEAEKKQLEMQQELDQLKKEIEELKKDQADPD